MHASVSAVFLTHSHTPIAHTNANPLFVLRCNTANTVNRNGRSSYKYTPTLTLHERSFPCEAQMCLDVFDAMRCDPMRCGQLRCWQFIFCGVSDLHSCAAGTSSQSGQACIDCVVGKYSPDTRIAVMYTVCPLFHGLWSFALSLGGSVALWLCRSCPGGSGNPSAGRTFCAVCNSGEFGAGGQPCASCLAGSFTAFAGQSACSLCQPRQLYFAHLCDRLHSV